MTAYTTALPTRPAESASPEECVRRVRRLRPRVTVVGDFLLDGWWTGRIERLAREAPAPVVELAERHDVPGGAANTALNLAALGARVRAVGAIGYDGAAEELRAQLAEAGVDVSLLVSVPGAHTTTKVRVEVDDRLLLRLDREQREEWPESVRRDLVGHVAEAVSRSDALLVCDYGSALLDDSVVSRLAGIQRPELVVVDAHEPRRWRELRPDVVTPNAAEAERVPGVSLGEDEDRAERASELSDRLLRATGAEAVLVTLDRSGTVLLRPGREPFRTRARPAPEQQASGAGDVFAAALTVARVAGASLESAAAFAQQAADVAVEQTGTCVCSLEDLGERLGVPAGTLPLAEHLSAREGASAT